MLKRLTPVVFFILCLTVAAFGAEPPKVRVLVLPVKVNAVEEMQYLQPEIHNALKTQLTQEGIEVVESAKTYPDSQAAPDLDVQAVRRLGLSTSVDFVVWGSLTLIGQQFSLDLKVIDVFEDTPPLALARAGEGLENLPIKLKELSDEIIVVILGQDIIADVQIAGNQRIEADAIKRVVKTSAGEIYSLKSLTEDLKSIYRMGYFDDVRIEAEDTPQGKRVIYRVEEKPTIRKIRIDGSNPAYTEEEIKENLTIKTGSILNIYQIQNNIERIEDLYREKNYHNVQVDYKLIEQSNNQADIEFEIDEKDKVLIKNIIFVGNQAFSSKELKKQMETSEKGFFSFITESGELKREDLNQDISSLEAFYQNNGYIRARVGEPEVEFKKEWIDITIKIDEGPRFRVGQVDIEGDLIFDKKLLLEKTQLRQEEYYNRTILRSDILTLSDLYADEGYAYVDVTPRIDEDPERLVVDIVYQIRKGEPVVFEEIIISGNTKTRDKVIRRQLEVYEQGLFSGSRLKRSIRNLYRLDYFQDVKVNTVRGSDAGKMVLKIDVEEKATGQFSIGGGYSNTDGPFVLGSISQRNLFGRGQILDLRAEIGGQTDRLSLGFTEPWLFDIPLSGSIRIFRWEREFDAYDRRSKGGSLTFGYPVWRDTRVSVGYNYDISNIDVTDPAGLPVSIEDLVAEFGDSNTVTSSVDAGVRYDSRDRLFSPSRGANHFLGIEYAGFGGEIGFRKYTAQLSWHIPLVWDFVGHFRGKGGYVKENSGYFLPDYELFFLGGINTIRGYDEDEIQPTDEDGNKIGGDRFAFFNFELIHPLLESAGLDGLIFFDTGAVVNPDAQDADQQDLDRSDFRESVGVEVRWNSPMGPIRLAYGIKLDRREGEDSGQWEFSIGAGF
jgi:outer membrane protein insertion porin family